MVTMPVAPQTGSQGTDARASARVLADWAKRTCPHLKPNSRCRLEFLPCCHLLQDPPTRCRWAEQGPALAAPELIYRAYLKVAGGPWWRLGRAVL